MNLHVFLPLAVFLAAFVSAMLCTASAALADLATQFGFSPRAVGMGNAVSALLDDYAACYHNPAGLALSGGNSFTIGYFYTAPEVKTRINGTDERVSFDNSLRAGVVGYRQNFRSLLPARWGRNVVAGLALAFPDNFKTGTLVRTHLYSELQFPVFGRAPDVLVMSGALGLELHKYVLIGVGLRFAVTYSGKNLTVYLNVPEGETVYQKVDVDSETEGMPIAGVIFRPGESLRLAAVWRAGGSVATLVGKGGGAARIGPLELPISLDLSFQDFFTPDEYAGAVSWAASDWLLFGLEVTYARWSQYNNPFGKKPPGEPFSDILIPRFGLEARMLKDLQARLGYYWRPSPVSDQQIATQYLDSDEHAFSFGLEYALHLTSLLEYPLRFAAYLQLQLLPKNTLETVNGRTEVWGCTTNVGGTIQFSF